MAMDLKERAEVMAKQEEAMRVSFNLDPVPKQKEASMIFSF